MGTRCVVKIQGMLPALYIHYDGYPSAKLPWLIEFYSNFYAKRGFDDSYCLAQLIRSTVSLKQFNLDPSTETGYGIVDCNDNCGQEYVYTLCKNGSISCGALTVWKPGDKTPTKKQLEELE